MHITDEQAVPLKAWLVQKLDDISDAESDVLADYVLALIKTDEPDTQLKQRCIGDLEEFLKDNTPRFVDEVIAAINSGSYDPKNARNSAQTTQAIPSFDGSNSTSSFAFNSGSQARKRSFHDDDTEMRDASSAGFNGRGRGDFRPTKHMRRGGNMYEQRGGGRGGYHNNTNRGGGAMNQRGQLPQMPQLDPNNPMGALLAMQAMISQMPGMTEAFNANGGSGGQDYQHVRRQPGKPCFDYENKGFCARGANCPYDHGSDKLVVAGGDRGGRGTYERGRGRGRGGRGDDHRAGRGGGRAPFSSAAPNNDQSITSVVVENIPAEQFNEDTVREFFAQFGTIEEISMQEQRRLAVIKYTDYASAKSAYDSPKVIFDNRFVKVYWHKPETFNGNQHHFKPKRAHENGNGSQGTDVEMQQGDTEAVDPAELVRKQEEAQRIHEEKANKVKAAQAQRAELNAKLKAQEAERAALMAKLAAKTGGGAVTASSGASTASTDAAEGGKDAAAQAKTEALKAKLAALENDARSMGINPNEEPSTDCVPRGRGGIRTRVSYRGGWRGRGAPVARGGGSVMRLDNRPKTVNVVLPKGKEMGSDVDEALKQFLLFSNLMESASVQAHPDRKDAAQVSFQQRYQAESFLNAAHKELPHIGKCELGWAPTSSSSAPTSAVEASDVNMDAGFPDPSTSGQRADVDYDVADDDDRWLVG